MPILRRRCLGVKKHRAPHVRYDWMSTRVSMEVIVTSKLVYNLFTGRIQPTYIGVVWLVLNHCSFPRHLVGKMVIHCSFAHH